MTNFALIFAAVAAVASAVTVGLTLQVRNRDQLDRAFRRFERISFILEDIQQAIAEANASVEEVRESILDSNALPPELPRALIEAGLSPDLVRRLEQRLRHASVGYWRRLPDVWALCQELGWYDPDPQRAMRHGQPPHVTDLTTLSFHCDRAVFMVEAQIVYVMSGALYMKPDRYEVGSNRRTRFQQISDRVKWSREMRKKPPIDDSGPTWVGGPA